MAEKLIWYRIATKYELVHDLVLEEQTVKVVEVEDKLICLGKYKGKYYALNNKCMHAGGYLGEGQCDFEGNVICPFHRYRYSLMTGKNTSGEGYYAVTFPLEMKDDGMYIGLKAKKWWQF